MEGIAIKNRALGASALTLVLGGMLGSLLLIRLYFAESNQGLVYFFVVAAFTLWFNQRGVKTSYGTLVIVYIGVLLDMLGNAFGYYPRFYWYDSVTHFYIPASIVLLAAPWLKSVSPKLSMAKVGWITVLLALAATFFYEIGEYWMQTLFHQQMIWGQFDTVVDMQWDAIGIFLAFGLVMLQHRISKSESQKKI